MERQPFVLGFLLRKFPEFDFKMDEFDDRLRLQKFIYLLQAHDIYLGYDFSWYLRGPYCTTLTAAGFALEGFYQQIPKRSKGTRFASRTIQKRFDRFTRFIKGKESDTNFLEAAASLHFLIRIRQLTDDDAVSMVAEKMPGVDASYVKGVLDCVRAEGLL